MEKYASSAATKTVTVMKFNAVVVSVRVQEGRNVISNSRGAHSTGPHGYGPTLSNRMSPSDDCMEGVNGCKGEEGDRSGDEGPAFSLHSQEGDTEAPHLVCTQTLGSSVSISKPKQASSIICCENFIKASTDLSGTRVPAYRKLVGDNLSCQC